MKSKQKPFQIESDFNILGNAPMLNSIAGTILGLLPHPLAACKGAR